MTWDCTLIAFYLSIFATTCMASSLDLCLLESNGTVTTSSNITWAQVVDQPIREFDGPSYLRPDNGAFFRIPVLNVLTRPFRRRVGPVGLQHRHSLGPHASRRRPRRQVEGSTNMVPWCYCFHHRI